MSDNGSKVQERRDIIGGGLRFGNVRLPVAGAIQHPKDNGKTVEIASEFHAHRQLEGVRLWIPETEISDN